MTTSQPPLEAQIFTEKQSVLERVLEYDKILNSKVQIPIFLEKSLKYLFDLGLQMEGIFRIDGNQTTMNKYKTRINNGEIIKMNFAREKLEVEDVSSLLKRFLGTSLTEPLFTNAYEESFYNLQNSNRDTNSVFLTLFSKLPPINQIVIKEVLNLLVQIDCNAHVNKMDAGNLSKVLSYMSNIFIQPKKDSYWILQYLVNEYINLFENRMALNTKKPFTLRKLIGHGRSILACFPIKGNVMTIDSGGILHLWDGTEYKLMGKENFNAPCYISPICVSFPEQNDSEYWIPLPEYIKVKTSSEVTSLSGGKTIAIPSIYSITEVDDTVWAVSDYIHIIDKSTKKEISRLSIPSSGTQSYIGYIGGNVWYWKDQKFTIYNPTRISIVHEFYIESMTKPYKCLQSGNNVWIATSRDVIIVIDIVTYKVKAVLNGHKGSIYNLEQVGPLILSTSWDTKILCWDPETFKLLGSIPNHHADAICGATANWREDRNGWDLWSISYDRSVQVTFIPKDYHLYFDKEFSLPEDISLHPINYLNKKDMLPTDYLLPIDKYEIKVCEKGFREDIDRLNQELSQLRDQVREKEISMRRLSASIDQKIQEALTGNITDLKKLKDEVIKQHAEEKKLFIEWSELHIKMALTHNSYRLKILDELELE